MNQVRLCQPIACIREFIRKAEVGAQVNGIVVSRMRLANSQGHAGGWPTDEALQSRSQHRDPAMVPRLT